MTQETLVLIKPDAVQRRMTGQLITAIENLGLTIFQLQQQILKEEEATAIYKEHSGKWHFSRNIRHITSGPSVCVHVRGRRAVEKCRNMIEAFRSAHSDLIKLPANLVHATSSEDKVNSELEAVGYLQLSAL